MPKPLDTNRLKQFETKAQIKVPQPTPTPVPRETGERWPSREPVRDGQISIKAPLDVIDHFKRICKDDRRTYADMLRILMEGYENPK